MDDRQLMVQVICITYNHENYIKDALEGFVRQKTNFRFEVIVHDDASTDRTTDIIKEYEKKYPDIIKPIYQTVNRYSQGLHILKTIIVPILAGKYIALCEGDDYWSDCNKLQKQVDFLEKCPDYVACVHNTKIMNMKDLSQQKFINASSDPYDVGFHDVIPGGGAVYQTSALMCRKKYFVNAYSDPRPAIFKAAKGFSDYALAIYLVTEGKVRYMPDIMSVYRQGTEGSWTSRNSGRESMIKHAENMLEFLDAVDCYTKYHYKDEIDEVRKRNAFHLAFLTNDYKRLRDKKYRGFWLALSTKVRLNFMIRNRMPGLYRIYRKLKDG